jgi:hypothetical protein
VLPTLQDRQCHGTAAAAAAKCKQRSARAWPTPRAGLLRSMLVGKCEKPPGGYALRQLCMTLTAIQTQCCVAILRQAASQQKGQHAFKVLPLAKALQLGCGRTMHASSTMRHACPRKTCSLAGKPATHVPSCDWCQLYILGGDSFACAPSFACRGQVTLRSCFAC